jgi:hypothetical protein
MGTIIKPANTHSVLSYVATAGANRLDGRE